MSEAFAAVRARIAEIRAIGAHFAGPTRSVFDGGGFATTFAAAQAEWSSPPLPASSEPGVLRPPAELEAYGNGKVPLDLLVPIGDGSERLYGPAANAWRRMTSDAWRAGVDLKVSDGYRTLADQHHLADELGLYRDGGLAAVPGTSSHGWGLSVDVDTDNGAGEWLERNAARYGFHADVPGEPWHWTYRPQPS